MDQSKSNSESKPASEDEQIAAPARTFTVEFFVGLFALAGVAAIGYQAIGLGGVELTDSRRYVVYAEFDNVAGLKRGAAVEIAGVEVGEVAQISLKDPEAIVALRIDRDIKIRDDDIAAIRTKGIIGDRYVKVSRGASDMLIQEGETIIETESVVDFEDIIGKIVHSLSGDDEEEE